ncbi:MAG: redoxin domain-containing protein, partial [Planctomycetales bacterium]|nr:redoxin domain-containing protein [Planctomycetales bacterium]
MAAVPPVCDFDWPAPEFELPATDGKTYRLADIAGPKGTLVVFICNHCPYVLAVIDRIIRDAKELQSMGVG